MRKSAWLVILFVGVMLLAAGTAFAQGAPQKDAYNGTVTIYGYVTDYDGNALSGLGWPAVTMKLWRRYGGPRQASWELLAETACARSSDGNGCPNQWSGYYQFDFDKWGGDLYGGRYRIEVGSETYGWVRREFYVDGVQAENFALDPNPVDVWLDWNRSKAEDGVVTLYYGVYNRSSWPIQALRQARVVAASETNEEEDILAVTKDVLRKTKVAYDEFDRPRTSSGIVVPEGENYRKWTIKVPELATVGLGQRVCVDLTLYYGYSGWDKYKLGKSYEPVCMVRTHTGFMFVKMPM